MKKTLRRIDGFGQTLIELLVALGVATVAVIAIVSAVSSSVANTTFSNLQGEADRRAREAVEWLRVERDKDWVEFEKKATQFGSLTCRTDIDDNGTQDGPFICTTWCIPTLEWTNHASCTTQTLQDSILKREVTMKQVEVSKRIEATVRVYWQDNKGTHEAQLNTRFTKWR